MIDGQNFFDHPVKNNLRAYDSTRKTDENYFKTIIR